MGPRPRGLAHSVTMSIVDPVDAEGLAGEPDEAVWLAAQQTGRFLIIEDLDFSVFPSSLWAAIMESC